MNKIKILIAEDVPSLNKGEEAILMGMLETFRILGDVEVCLYSSNPQIDAARYGTKIKVVDNKMGRAINKKILPILVIKIVKFLYINLMHLLFALLYKIFDQNATKIMKADIWKEYCKSDLIIIGHDSAFGFFSHVHIILLAKFLRKPTVVYAGSVAFSGRIRSKLAKFILNKVDLITLRERSSYEYLKKIGVNRPPMFVTADTAFLLPPASFEKVEEIMVKEKIKSNRPLIGMTMTREISCRAFPNLRNPKERYDECIKLMAQVVDYLIDTLNATIVFLPHCIGPGEELDDRIVAKDIYQAVRNKHKVKVITNEYTAEELKGLIGQFDLFIGERLHSVISAISMLVPSIAILYPSHRDEILREVLDNKWICSIENLDIGTLKSKLYEIWSGKEEIRKKLINKMKSVKERALLNGKLIKDLLSQNELDSQ